MTLFPTIVEGKGLAKPLGVTFDEQMGEWIVADSGSDRIVLLPLSRAITDEGNRKGRIVYPSAVSILNQGENAVVLTARDIRIVAHGDSQQLTPSVVITKIQGYARGLAVTRLKYVVTMLYDRADGWTVNLFEGKENGATAIANSMEAVFGDNVRAVLHGFPYARKHARRDGPR
ncbi:unnamed protein product [Heligmosomoides polygyrus]|uniref:Restriction endonuclease n=1 Tax=Heligmosomoides polygyrus TaxID=6339 RepID=A0A183GPK8_HELPZ|nr:unnamed protein product [Heligmosomoides polygyrus]